jgi:CBS domain-containing protein
MPIRSIHELIEAKSPISLPPGTSVRDAARVMADQRIGAVLVVEANQLVGIFTERDLVNRVVARGLNPEVTLLIHVMTTAPVTVAPDQGLAEAYGYHVGKGLSSSVGRQPGQGRRSNSHYGYFHGTAHHISKESMAICSTF